MADADQLAAGDMFKNLVEPWMQYTAKLEQGWALDDPRRELRLEILERFFQLDIVREYLDRALRILAGHPIKNELIAQAFAELSTGEPTKEKVEKYMEIQLDLDAKFPDDRPRALKEVRLFTEAFYFFAWRLVEILTSKAFPFNGFGKLKQNVKGIQNVRNHLIEHPETLSKNFHQSFAITSDGPALKSMAPVIELGTGKSAPEETSLDRGLFVNAQELHDAIIDILSRA